MWVHVDGEFVPQDRPAIRPLDRGLVFGDGLFEVMRIVRGRVLFLGEHLARMRQSAAFFQLSVPHRDEEIESIARELARRNGIDDGEVYLELTRGVGPSRDHRYPPPGTPPTFLVMVIPLRPIDPANWEAGAAVYTYPDLRGKLCEHKTLNLLPNVMAKNHAYARGGYEAVMLREVHGRPYVTEGGSSSYLAVLGGTLVSPAIDNILPSITRDKVLGLARELGYPVEERRLWLDELLAADEVMLLSTVSGTMPVRSVDDTAFPTPGPVAVTLMRAYAAMLRGV